MTLPGISHHPYRTLAIIAGIFVLLAGSIIAAGMIGVAAASADTILPGVAVGGAPVGGLTRRQAAAVLQKRIDDIINRGFTFTAGARSAVILPTTLSPDDPDLTKERLTVHLDAMINDALRVGHEGPLLARAVELVRVKFSGGAALPLRFTLDEATTAADIRSTFQDLEKQKREPSFALTSADGVFAFRAIPGEDGTRLDTAVAIAHLKSALTSGTPPPINVPVRREPTRLSFADVEALVPAAERVANAFPATGTLRYGKRTWTITREAVAGWIGAAIDEDKQRPALAIAPERLDPFFDDLGREVEVAAQDARLRLEGKRVVEFQPSREGVAIDRPATRGAFEAAWIGGSASQEVDLVVTKTAPKVAVGDLNNLGVKEILGTGTSNFSGSPRNRVKNIRHGIEKLNGILIAPDEEFSLLAALRPFTAEDGYLPELVIKGDKIEPEIGGGLCQIGSTTFRAAMNSGLKITRRRNHSLVVRYYNDPSNKNPGTDATIYDPDPDFRFINDTGKHILFTTKMNTETGELTFSFWGTSDGRKGSYNPPTVTKWYPTGPDKEIPTTDLEPGKRNCQTAHPGADAHFTYTRALADGTKEETLYTSHYRALPRVCLVGVAPDQMPATTPDASAVPAPDATAAADAGAPAN